MKKLFFAVLTCAAMIGIASCASDQRNGWTLNGKVDGSDGCKLCLEQFENGRWLLIDSIAVAEDGSFEYTAVAPAPYPDVMRVRLDGKCIYFPVDSLTGITINTTAKDFDKGYKLEGSKQAAIMQSIDSTLNAAIEASSANAVISNYAFKKQLFAKTQEDSTLVCMYYLINRSIDNKPLFNPNNVKDRSLYGAVAQSFNTRRPNDPRTKDIVNTHLRGLAASSDFEAEIPVEEVSVFDIVRCDAAGKEHSLADMVSKDKVVILSFTQYSNEASPVYNIILNELWNEYHDKGLEIYQIAFDQNESFWKTCVDNLPWTAVWNATTDGNMPLIQYNVGALPTTFIFDRNGDLTKSRITGTPDRSTFEKELKKYL